MSVSDVAVRLRSDLGESMRQGPFQKLRGVAFADAVVRYRGLVFALTILWVAAGSAGLGSLRFTSDYTYHLDAASSELQAFLRLERTFTPNDSLAFVIAPTQGEIFRTGQLEALRWLTEESWQTPGAVRVDSLTNYQHTRAVGDHLFVEDLVPSGSLAADQIPGIRAIALNDPQVRGRLVAADGRAATVHVTLSLPKDGSGATATTEFARGLARELETRSPDLRVGVTGIAPLADAMDRAAKRDLGFLFPVMLGVLALAMVWSLGSGWATVGILTVAAAASLFALGLAGWLGIPMTPPSANAPTLILTIAVADGVHLVVAYRKRRRAGASREASIAEALRSNGWPLFLTSLTTLIGFVALRASGVPPYIDLGLITAFGVGAAWLLSVSFLPAWLATVPEGNTRRRERSATFEMTINRLIGRPALTLGLSVAIVAVSALAIPRIVVDDLFTTWFDESTPFRRDTDFAAERMPGLFTIHYAVPAGQSGAVADPEYLRFLDHFAVWLRGHEGVAHVVVWSDVVKRLHRDLHGGDTAFETIPDDRALIAQYLLLYEMSLPYGLDLNHQLDVERSTSQVVIAVNGARATELRAIESEISGWLAANGPPATHVRGTGIALLFANLSKRSIEAMTVGTLVAFVAIALVLIVAFRNASIGVLSLVPNVVPSLVAFGVWGLTFREVGLAVSVVSAASLGLIVDATVHLLSRYVSKRRAGATPERAIRFALTEAGPALARSSLILLAGFAVLASSDFQANAHFGLLMAMTIGAALVADFLLLPSLLLVGARFRTRAGAFAPLPEKASVDVATPQT